MDAKELIILGTGPSRHECPFDCETWGVNATYTQREQRETVNEPFRHDKLFITDYLFSVQGTLHFDINRIKRLVDAYGTQVLTLHPIRLGKHKLESTPYPLKKVMRKLGSEYLSSTISYMLAYALYVSTTARNGKVELRPDAYTKLRLFGIDMSSSLEYRLQKGGVEFWLGYAQGLGIEYTVATESTIMKTPTGLPYGMRPKIKLEEIDPYNLLGVRKR